MLVPSFLHFLQENSSVNKGDVFEFVLASACIARLGATKSKHPLIPISAEAVIKIMEDFFEKKKDQLGI